MFNGILSYKTYGYATLLLKTCRICDIVILTQNYVNYGEKMIDFKWNNVIFEITDLGGGALGENISMHSHAINSYELHFITGGKGKLITDNKEYHLQSGDFFITGPCVNHSQITDPLDKTQDVFVTIQAKDTKKANKIATLFLETSFYFCRNFGMSTAKELLKEKKEKKLDYQSAISALCKKLMTEIIRKIAPANSSFEEEVQDLNEKRFVIIEQSFLYDKGLTLSQLSEKIGVCERQTQRLLKKYYGKTFREIMRDKNKKV